MKGSMSMSVQVLSRGSFNQKQTKLKLAKAPSTVLPSCSHVIRPCKFVKTEYANYNLLVLLSVSTLAASLLHFP